MRTRSMSGGLLLLAVMTAAGCGSKPDGGAVADPQNNGAAPKGENPKATSPVVATRPPTKSGKDAKATKPDAVVDKNDGTQAEAATELTRLEHKAFVVFYKGFTEDQMKAYLDHIDKYYTSGKEPRKNYEMFSYQVKLAKEQKGMRVVREDGFTRILFPVEARFRKPDDPGAKRNYAALAIPLCHSLIKIDESVRGNVAHATCDDDGSVIYLGGDHFPKR